MNRRIMVIFLLIGLLPGVTASIGGLYDDALLVWHGDDSTSDTSRFAVDGVSNGDPSVDSTNYQLGTASIDFDGSADWVSWDTTNNHFSSSTDTSVFAWIRSTSDTGSVEQIVTTMGDVADITGTWRLWYDNRATDILKFDLFHSSGQSLSMSHTQDIDDSVFHHVGVVLNKTGGTVWGYFYFNGTLVDTSSLSQTHGPIAEDLTIGARAGPSTREEFNGNIDEVTVFNKSLSSSEVALLWNNGQGQELVGASPPELSNFNMTSDGGLGCTVWQNDTNTVCSTEDTTPTVTFATDTAAYCAIGNSNLNYTAMGSARNCTGGEGTQTHTCTLRPSDSLTTQDSFIYISCKDVSGNENATSSSGPLRISVLWDSIETANLQAIESGIVNALDSGYTVFSNQKIYARNSANEQVLGTFDRVVRWMNKIWAISYLSENETASGMMNITPVLYVLEMQNATSTEVNTSVYTLITQTK